MQTLERKIFDFVTRPGYKGIKAKSLAKKLGFTKKQRPEFLTALESLIASGRIREGRSGRLRARVSPDTMAGIVRRTSGGAGYFLPHSPPREETWTGPGQLIAEIYIAGHDMQDAQTGDEVLVRLLKERRRGGQRCGRIEEIVERATTTFVGTYLERDGEGYVQVDGRAFPEPVLVDDPGAKRAQPDDKVVIEMIRFPSRFQTGEAVLTRVLGTRGEPGIDELSIIHEFALSDEFPSEVLEEARAQADRFDETNVDGRLDLTSETIVTIDPVDAHDFDDAISLTRIEHGHWRLGVHIADVSHFVPPGSALDGEARKRGTSVYLPGRALPMLPEVVSNGLASLQQKRTRYAKSVFIEFAPDGVPVHTEFANSAVKVTRRLAFKDVMPIVREPDRFRKRVTTKVCDLLARMYEFAMILRKRRRVAGSLDLNIPEVKVDLDKSGRVTGAHRVEHDESHQIVEEFMLAANIAVATELHDRGISFLRRVHDDPSLPKLRAFAEFVKTLDFALKQCQSRTALQSLLNSAKGKPTEYAVNYALLRSMKPAEYSAEELGHYALAVANYCHFTSPIRRYPDLTIHRLLGEILDGTVSAPGPHETEWAKLGKHCSLTERRAAAAERELKKLKLLTYMQSRIGQEMDAVITGVERFGFFCQGIEIPAEGLIHISWLSAEDHFDYDPTLMALVGRRSGRQFRLGDQVRVVVAHVDVDRRELDFRVAAKQPRKPSKKGTKRPAPKRSTQGNRKGSKWR